MTSCAELWWSNHRRRPDWDQWSNRVFPGRPYWCVCGSIRWSSPHFSCLSSGCNTQGLAVTLDCSGAHTHRPFLRVRRFTLQTLRQITHATKSLRFGREAKMLWSHCSRKEGFFSAVYSGRGHWGPLWQWHRVTSLPERSSPTLQVWEITWQTRPILEKQRNLNFLYGKKLYWPRDLCCVKPTWRDKYLRARGG